jgi:hypothetical protein
MMSAVDIASEGLSRRELASLPAGERFVRELAQSLDRKRLERGKLLYYVTVTYTESKEFPITLNAANRFLRCFHLRLLEYLAGSSRFHRPWFRAIEPELHAFIDVPGSKPLRTFRKLTVPTRESTFHHHIVAVVDERHRVKFDELVNDPTVLSASVRDCRIRTVHVLPIDPTLRDVTRVVDYSSRHARKFLDKSQRNDEPARKSQRYDLPEWDDMYLPFPINPATRATTKPHTR